MAICEEPEISDESAYVTGLHERLLQKRVPVTGTISLTDRCNLKCVHCYARCATPDGQLKAQEIGTDAHLRILDEVAGAGCLYLLLTGGEPLIRPDFGKIYTHAKKNGMLVTVFSNGTRITKQTVSLFADLPPRKVEISIYGATANTHDGITGVPGSFERCRLGIAMLLDAGVNVTLKTILMTRNRHEFEDMEKMAQDFGTKFRFDACIFPRLDGSSDPLALRLAPDEVVRIDFSDPKRISSWQKYFAPRRDGVPTDRIYSCGAGLTSFWIDPYGNLKPCVLVQRGIRNIACGGFDEAWKDLSRQMDLARYQHQSACRQCDKKALCGYCPGFFALESGSEIVHSPFLCAIGQRRFDYLNGGHHGRRGTENEV